MFSYILDTRVSIPVSTIRILHRSLCNVEIVSSCSQILYARNSQTRTVLSYAHTANKLEVFLKFVQLSLLPISSGGGAQQWRWFFPLFKSRTFYEEAITIFLQADTCKSVRTKLSNKLPGEHNLLYQGSGLICSCWFCLETYTRTVDNLLPCCGCYFGNVAFYIQFSLHVCNPTFAHKTWGVNPPGSSKN